MSSKITLGVTLDNYRPKKDKSFSLTFSTYELTPEQVMVVNELHGKMGVLYFADKEVLSADEVDVLDSVDIELEKKSYSQRLRGVLFVLHKQLGGNESNFKGFYEQQMEHFITSIKNKLE
jgi:hypothetical protein